jgi:hypothetical protein
MGEIHLCVSEMLADGMEDQEIARIIAIDFDVDRDFALNLVEEIYDEIAQSEDQSDLSSPYYGA